MITVRYENGDSYEDMSFDDDVTYTIDKDFIRFTKPNNKLLTGEKREEAILPTYRLIIIWRDDEE